MAAKVPAIDRTNLVLDLLAEDPLRSYRAADVAKQTGMHRASCFSLLTALADAGLVTRFPDGPRYRLGPLLIRYGAKSAAGHAGFEAARRAMFRLSDELGCGCMVSGRIGYEHVTLDCVGVDGSAFPGDRSPIRAPRGTVFLAWAPAAELAEWLEWSGAEATEEERRAFVRTAAAIRARGYSLGADVELGLSLERIARQLSAGSDPRHLDELLYEIAVRLGRSGPTDAGAESFNESVHRISAPIFDRLGRVRLALTLVSDRVPFPSESVEEYAGRLVATANRLSEGRPPQGSASE